MAEQQKSYKKVMAYLEKEIRNGNISFGEQLPPERELAEHLGISRNSVREAMRQLEHMGFLISNQGSGNFISCDIQQNLQDSFNMLILLQKIGYRQLAELRTGLELETSLLAADRITDEQIDDLEKTVAEMYSCAPSRGDLLDKHLHKIIAEASGNGLIIQILQALSGTIDRFIHDMRQHIFLDPKTGKQLQYAHEQIVSALSRHDKIQLVLAVIHHFNIINENMYPEDDARYVSSQNYNAETKNGKRVKAEKD